MRYNIDWLMSCEVLLVYIMRGKQSENHKNDYQRITLQGRYGIMDAIKVTLAYHCTRKITVYEKDKICYISD